MILYLEYKYIYINICMTLLDSSTGTNLRQELNAELDRFLSPETLDSKLPSSGYIAVHL